jgi:hypothetical protein
LGKDWRLAAALLLLLLKLLLMLLSAAVNAQLLKSWNLLLI